MCLTVASAWTTRNQPTVYSPHFSWTLTHAKQFIMRPPAATGATPSPLPTLITFPAGNIHTKHAQEARHRLSTTNQQQAQLGRKGQTLSSHKFRKGSNCFHRERWTPSRLAKSAQKIAKTSQHRPRETEPKKQIYCHSPRCMHQKARWPTYRSAVLVSLDATHVGFDSRSRRCAYLPPNDCMHLSVSCSHREMPVSQQRAPCSLESVSTGNLLCSEATCVTVCWPQCIFSENRENLSND